MVMFAIRRSGLRTDKRAAEVVRESAAPAAGGAATRAPSSVKVTHPDRVVDPPTGLKKIDVVRYYESIADWMLPHLKGRPVSLVRAPEGITGELFFSRMRRLAIEAEPARNDASVSATTRGPCTELAWPYALSTTG